MTKKRSVVGVSDPNLALAKLKESPHAYSLAITDLTMPGITGIELATRFLRLKPNLPIILVTGYSGSITPAAAKALGIRELLFKPLTLAAAAQAINRVLSPTSVQ
jgi:CheY-like chemotaxis protein